MTKKDDIENRISVTSVSRIKLRTPLLVCISAWWRGRLTQFSVWPLVVLLALVQIAIFVPATVVATPRDSIEQKYDSMLAQHSEKISTLDSKVDFLDKKVDLLKDYANFSQKSIDWWIGLLSILATLFGLGIPIALAIKIRADHRKNMDEANAVAAESRRYLNEIQEHFAETKSTAAELKATLNRELEEVAKRVTSARPSSENQTSEIAVTSQETTAVNKVLNDPTSGTTQRLLALAISLQGGQEWTRAAGIWDALYTLEPSSFNALRLAACLRIVASADKNLSVPNAVEFLERALKLGRHVLSIEADANLIADAWLEVGAAYSTKGDKISDPVERLALYKEGVVAIKTALIDTLNPGDRVFRLTYLGSTLQSQFSLLSDMEAQKSVCLEAVDNLKIAVRLDGRNRWAWSCLALCYMSLTLLAADIAEKKKWKQLAEISEKMRDELDATASN